MRPLDVHYYWCRFTGSIKTSNICCGSSGGAGISSGGAGISSGGAGFSSGDAGILLVRVRVRWCWISSGGAGITSGGISDSDSHLKCMH